MSDAARERTGGPGRKEKQEKPSVQPAEDQQAQETCEDEAHHGGRTKWPDEDVNPASDIHVDEGEEGEPARTGDHDALRRADRKKPRKG